MEKSEPCLGRNLRSGGALVLGSVRGLLEPLWSLLATALGKSRRQGGQSEGLGVLSASKS